MKRYLVFILMGLGLASVPTLAHAQALSTSGVGFALRKVTYTPLKTQQQTLTEASDAAKDVQQIENLNGPMLCQRVSAATSLGLELGAGGCIQPGGLRTFDYATSWHTLLAYFPFASRSRIANDMSVEVSRQHLGDFYILGQGGFAKVTHFQNTTSTVTLTTDFMEFGGGVGWNMRITSRIGIAFEATYLFGAGLSSATTGTESVISAGTALMVAL